MSAGALGLEMFSQSLLSHPVLPVLPVPPSHPPRKVRTLPSQALGRASPCVQELALDPTWNFVKTRLYFVSRPGELSNSGLQEEDGGGKEEAKDENEDWEATPAGESQVRQSGEGEVRR